MAELAEAGEVGEEGEEGEGEGNEEEEPESAKKTLKEFEKFSDSTNIDNFKKKASMGVGNILPNVKKSFSNAMDRISNAFSSSSSSKVNPSINDPDAAGTVFSPRGENLSAKLPEPKTVKRKPDSVIENIKKSRTATENITPNIDNIKSNIGNAKFEEIHALIKDPFGGASVGNLKMKKYL